MTEQQEKRPVGRPSSQTVSAPTDPGWRPAKRLGYLKAPSGFTARWVSVDSDNVQRKKEEGWIVMKPSDNKGGNLGLQDVNDGGSPANDIRYRDMIAMMLPDAVKKERDEYYRSENRRATDVILKKTDKDLKNMGVSTYRPNGQSGRIVIE